MSFRDRIVFLVSLCAATAAQAVTIPVNTTLMTVANDGKCSLPEAIIAANTNMSSGNAMGECPAGNGADSIQLQFGTTYTMTTGAFGSSNGADALPPITTVIEIIGNGATVERSLMAATLFRLFEVSSSGTLTLANLTIANGHAGTDFSDGYGGGCIFSKGNLIVTDTLVSGCQAGAATFGDGGDGGAIFAAGGSLSVIGSVIKLSVGGVGVHFGGDGGGIATVGIPVTIQDTTVSDNAAGGGFFGGNGGGISIKDGMLTLLRSAVSSNDAASTTDPNGTPGNGGGIHVEAADVSIEGSELGSNVAGSNTFRSGDGGGLYMTGSGNPGSLRITGSSIVSNASGAGVSSSTYGSHAGMGGGLYIDNVIDVAILGSQLRYNLGGNGGAVTGPSGSAGDGGSGAAMWIQNVPTLHITGSLIELNANGKGGDASNGSYAGQGGDGPVTLNSVITATIEDTMLRENSSGNGGSATGSGSTGGIGGRGGALLAESSNITMSRCSVVGNHAGDGGNGDSPERGGSGGGLIFPSSGQITIVNTTVSGNSGGVGGTGPSGGGNGGSGGGISNSAFLVLTNCTLSDNSAGPAGNGFNGLGGNLHNLNGVTITNSLLANSQFGGDCFNQASMNNLNLGNNIVEDNSCGFTSGSDPRLAPLGFYGGATLSHALCTAAGVPDVTCVGPSPAIDAGADATCSNMFVQGIDQREALRNAGAHCDIGAVESSADATIALTGDAALFPGGMACMGVRAASGYPLETLTAQLDYDGNFTFVDADINPLIGPSTASDKQLSRLSLSASSDMFSVFGGNGGIPSGTAFTAVFSTSASTPTGVYPITPLPFGNLVVTNCAGDCDGNGTVTLKEVQRCVGKFLGQPLCNLQEAGLSCTVVDANFDGKTSLAELQRCANHKVGSCP